MKKFLSVLLFLLLIGVLFLISPDKSIEEIRSDYADEFSQFIRINGMDIHFKDEGNPRDSVPIVLIHGTSSSLHTWDGVVDELVGDRRVIRMDLPGFGVTGPDTHHDYSMNQYQVIMREFLDALGVFKADVVGNSLGARIAWIYACRYPKKVRKLALLNSAGFPLKGGKGSLAFTLAQIPVIKHVLKYITPTFVVRKSLEDVYFADSLVTDNLVQRYRDLALREGNRDALVHRFSNEDFSDTTCLPYLSQRTLILWGDSDQLIIPKYADKFADLLPNDTLVIMQNTGHVPMEENPEETGRILREFLSE